MKKILTWIGIGCSVFVLIGGAYAVIELNIAHDFAGRLSPDGSMIVFNSYIEGKSRIFLMDSDGRNQRPISYAETNGNDVQPFWSPNGRNIAFTSQEGGEGIYIMDRDGNNQKLVISHEEGFVQFGSWSPDGEYIYFFGKFKQQAYSQIYRVHASGLGLEQITDSSELSFTTPRVSPDNAEIYFTGMNPKGQDAIFVMELITGEITRLTDFEDGFGVADISSDGEDLVFTSKKEGNYEVYMMNIESGAIKRLTYSQADEHFVGYTPDCSRIIFSIQGNVGSDILSMSSNGTMLENITKNTRYK